METSNKNMTEQERLALAAKLDDDLDTFINSLEKRRPEDRMTLDKWEEEIEKHPFFMKKAPEPGEDVHPLMEGLQQLKFDPEDNSPDELAEKYKEDGNYWLKHRKYRIAIMNYTEGIMQKPSNKEMLANLFNNRSAAQFFLKNFRSSTADARTALLHKSDYAKAKLRIMKCLMELKKYDELCEDVKKFLADDPTNMELIDMQKFAVTKKTEKLRDERKLQMAEKKKRQEFQTLVQVLVQRGVKFEGVKNLSADLTVEVLKPKVDPLEMHPVTLDKHGNVYYPAIFCYPEFQLTDLQQQMSEITTIRECLDEMFADDEEGTRKYLSADGLNVYYENRQAAKIIKVNTKKALKDIVNERDFWIYNGYLTFYVIPEGSPAEKEFLSQPRKPLILC